MTKRRPKIHTLDLALQGGGAHGAFTWGALERLLEADRISIGSVSGASAGALNAAMLVSGLVTGGSEGAANKLKAFWTAVNRSARRSSFLLFMEAFPDAFRAADTLWSMAGGDSVSVSLPPRLGRHAQHELRDILEEHVDFDAVRSPEAPRIFISATNARTGAARIFRNEDLSLEALLASACLPLHFPPVTIDGDDYWDGGYSANPPIIPLVQESDNDDLLMVTVNPIARKTTPRSVAEIPDRISEMMFNQSLIKELRGLSLMKEGIGRRLVYSGKLIRAIHDLRIHEIHDEETLSKIDPRSKMTPIWQLLLQLHEAGRQAAEAWLKTSATDLGKRSSANLADRYL